MAGSVWAVFLTLVTLPCAIATSQCTCYDTYANFQARANDVFRNAVVDRRLRERADQSRAALEQVQNEMLQGRDPANNADMAATTAFTCEVRVSRP